jgi:hypothetical protein
MNQEVEPVDDMDAVLPVAQQQAITRAALLAHQGRLFEAEAARYAGGYHNLGTDA